MANKKARQQEIINANKRKYDMAKKTLKMWPAITAAILVVAVLTVFVPFVDIYNDPNVAGAFNPSANGGRPFVEIGASGWNCLEIFIKNDYTSAESQLAPFYYHVTQTGGEPFVTMLATATFVAVASIVLSLVTQAVIFFTKAHKLSLITAALDFIAAAAFIVAFASALACSGKMIPGYCSGNPACSVRSFALFPAIFAAGAVAIDVIHFMKCRQVERLGE